VGKSSESEVADSMYDLILELHTIDSSVLLAVMPQLEYKLPHETPPNRCGDYSYDKMGGLVFIVTCDVCAFLL